MAFDLTSANFTVRSDKPDERDFYYKSSVKSFRENVDLREWASIVEDQGHIGSCLGNAITNAYELLLKKDYPDQFAELSRLFVYYNARELEGSTAEDEGASVRDGIKAVSKKGICTEQLWPYDIEKFDDKPTEECYIDAKQRLIKNYQKITLVYDMVDALNHNNPIVLGMEIFNGFMTLSKEDSTVYMPMYQLASVGGHAVCLVGYDLPANLFLAKNSFGTDWGDNGYCWIPFAYVARWGHSSWIFDLDLHPAVLQS